MGSQLVRKINRIGAPVPINTLESPRRRNLDITRPIDREQPKSQRRDHNDKPTAHRQSPYFLAQRQTKTSVQVSLDDSIYDSQDDMLSVSSTSKTKTIRDVGAAPAFRIPSVSSGSQKRSRGRRTRGQMDLTNDSDVSESTMRDRLSTPSPSPSRVQSDIVGTHRRLPRRQSPYRTASPVPADALDTIDDSDDEISHPKAIVSEQKSTEGRSLAQARHQKSPTHIEGLRVNTSSLKNADYYVVMKLSKALSGKFMYEKDDLSAQSLSIRCHSTTPGHGRPFGHGIDKNEFRWLYLNFHMIANVRYAPGCPIIAIQRPRGIDTPPKVLLEFENLAAVDFIVDQVHTKAKAIEQTTLEKMMEEGWKAADACRQKNVESKYYSDELQPQNEPQTKQILAVEILGTNLSKSTDDQPHRSPLTMPASLKRVAPKPASPLRGGQTDLGTRLIDSYDVDRAETRNIRETRSSIKSAPAHTRREKPLLTWTQMNPEWRNLWTTPLTYPIVGKNRATVDLEDIARLDEGEYLNDNLITFYFRYFQEKMNEQKPELAAKVHFFNSFFYDKLRQKPTNGSTAFDGVRSWTSKIDLFGFDYLFLPVNEHAHWYLVLIANPGYTLPAKGFDDREKSREEVTPTRSPLAEVEHDLSGINIDGHNIQRQTRQRSNQDQSPIAETQSFKSDPGTDRRATKTPNIITLDSLGNSHPTTIRVLKSYLIDEAKDKKGAVGNLATGSTAKYGLPQQNNYCDCGIFLIAYLELFLRDPDDAFQKMVSRESVEWSIDPNKWRADLRDLIFQLHKEQVEHEERERQVRRAARAAALSSPASRIPKTAEATPVTKRPASAQSYHFTTRLDDEMLGNGEKMPARRYATKQDPLSTESDRGDTLKGRQTAPPSESSHVEYSLIKKLPSSPTPGSIVGKRKVSIDSDEEAAATSSTTSKRPKSTSDTGTKRVSWPLSPYHGRKVETIDTKAKHKHKHTYMGIERQARRR